MMKLLVVFYLLLYVVCFDVFEWFSLPLGATILLFGYGKCSKISNTLKLRTPKIIAENNF